jgi:hypothetical protein
VNNPERVYLITADGPIAVWMFGKGSEYLFLDDDGQECRRCPRRGPDDWPDFAYPAVDAARRAALAGLSKQLAAVRPRHEQLIEREETSLRQQMKKWSDR